ncbi:MAG TPA: dual specificity protein phosphatase [Thermoanaerobaculia bacterium]
MNTFCIDEAGCLFISPRIDDWQLLEEHGISTVIDLEGGLDDGVPSAPNHVLYLYYPIFDEDLPDLDKLKAVARLGSSLIQAGHKVLSHCGMGFNRSALVAGLILVHLGLSGEEAYQLLRSKRPGALFNEVFANYLRGLPPAT